MITPSTCLLDELSSWERELYACYRYREMILSHKFDSGSKNLLVNTARESEDS
jgi:hypothetical protein